MPLKNKIMGLKVLAAPALIGPLLPGAKEKAEFIFRGI